MLKHCTVAVCMVAVGNAWHPSAGLWLLGAPARQLGTVAACVAQ